MTSAKPGKTKKEGSTDSGQVHWHSRLLISGWIGTYTSDRARTPDNAICIGQCPVCSVPFLIARFYRAPATFNAARRCSVVPCSPADRSNAWDSSVCGGVTLNTILLLTPLPHRRWMHLSTLLAQLRCGSRYRSTEMDIHIVTIHRYARRCCFLRGSVGCVSVVYDSSAHGDLYMSITMLMWLYICCVYGITQIADKRTIGESIVVYRNSHRLPFCSILRNLHRITLPWQLTTEAGVRANLNIECNRGNRGIRTLWNFVRIG